MKKKVKEQIIDEFSYSLEDLKYFSRVYIKDAEKKKIVTSVSSNYWVISG